MDAVLMHPRYAWGFAEGTVVTGKVGSAFDDRGRMLYKRRELEPPGSGRQSSQTTLLSSSMAEHSAVNRRVVGSSPT